MFDIALPDKNEEELVKEYIRKGYRNVVFLYKVSNFEDTNIFRSVKNFPRINIYYGAIINVSKAKKALSLAAELFYNVKFFNDLVFILSRDFKFNRLAINKYFHNGLVNPGYLKVEDHPNVRYIAIPTKFLKRIVENNLSIVFSIKELKKEYVFLGRVMYLIKILQKKNIPVILGSFATHPEEVPYKSYLLAWRRILGINYPKDLVFSKFIWNQIRRTRKAKSPWIFAEGFEIIKFPYEDCSEE
ncbi:MAG TPA: hypothetical protein EYH09_01085 [Candidatus Nanopusillus sp.]|nr:hypothetical protein [Candidatus Nanopusillus sp.]